MTNKQREIQARILAERKAAGLPIGEWPEDKKPFDSLDFIMAYEGGELDEEAIISGFQALIDSGLVWELQGSYGRTATALLAGGFCHAPA